MSGIFRRQGRIFQNSASVLEYGLHRANVATRECEAGRCSKVVIFFDLRKQNHKKPTNIFNFLTFLGRKSLEEDHRVPTFAIAIGKYAPPIKQNEEILPDFM